MRRYNPLATCPVPLGNLGVDPAPQNLTALNIDAKMDFYGTYILLNEQVTLQNQDPVLNEATQRLGKKYAQDKLSLIDLELQEAA
jgi:N4-gp56 family major capsid protein